MKQIAWIRRIRDVEHRRAVAFFSARQRIHVTTGVVADIGDIAVALPMNDRLIRAAALQVVITDEPHIERFRPVTHSLRMCGQSDPEQGGGQCGRYRMSYERRWEHGPLLF